MSSSHFSVQITGTSCGFFKAKRGLRRGDPLSPFLFRIVAVAFSYLISKGIENNLFKGLEVGRNGLGFTIMQMPQSALLEATEAGFYNLKKVIYCF